MSPLLRAFLINAALLGVAILSLAGLNGVVDPYGANGWVDLALEKEEIVGRLSYFDALFARFERGPAPVVVVGDSRMNQLPEDELTAAAGRPVFNLSAGGAFWPEILTLAQHAAETDGVEHLVVQVNVDLMNGSVRVDRAADARDLLAAPLQYYLHPRITQASAVVVWNAASGSGGVDETPPMDEEAFWTHQIDAVGRIRMARWSPPAETLKQLRALANTCAEAKVRLTFVMLPVHQDIRRELERLGRAQALAEVRDELRAIAPLIDLDIDSPVTVDRSRFRDPFHLRRGEDQVVLDAVFGDTMSDDPRWRASRP